MSSNESNGSSNVKTIGVPGKEIVCGPWVIAS